MPNTREKLIEALNAIAHENCFGSIEKIADYLIANGVTIPVRCKDCKHRVDDMDFVCGHFCTKRPSAGGYFCEDNDFCSLGERRNDG